MAEQAVLGLGSNLGDRQAYLRRAVEGLKRLDGVRLLAVSSLYETPPLDVPDQQGDYLNQVAVVSAQLLAPRLLAHCQDIEVALGRPGNHVPGNPRTIDIDLIVYGTLVLNTDELVLPHPAYTRRKFVLLPLAEVLPAFRDPLSGRTVQQLLEDCPDISHIERWEILEKVPC